MIECNVYMNKSRTLDGKKVYARFSKAFMEKETNHVFAEIPEDRTESDFIATFSGKIRKDQTGEVYGVAHDVEDAPYTYTEVFPDPRRICAFDNTGTAISMNTRPYPTYYYSRTYNKGDRVVDAGAGNIRVYESEFDNNKGNPPNIYGWEMLTPYIPEQPEIEYVTIEEFNAIIDELAAEQTDGGES